MWGSDGVGGLRVSARVRGRAAELLCLLGFVAWFLVLGVEAQVGFPDAAAQKARAKAFVAQRQRVAAVVSGARASAALPRVGSLGAAWIPLGPLAVTSASYGKVSGRVTAVAVDPNDASGNTVYVGTTGGGVWKSVNAAGPLAGVSFTALTDTLPVFAANNSSGVIPSLSIGSVAVQPVSNPVVLAGTGDPNDATDSYYGEGILRSADGGLTWTLVQGSRDGAAGNHSFVGLSVAGLAWSSSTPTLAVAAVSDAAEGVAVGAGNAVSVRGLYYSNDAGVTWKMATLYDGASVVQQPQALGTGQVGNAASAVVWDGLRQRFYAAVRAHGFYESADGATWTRLVNQPGAGLTSAACPVGANGLGAASCPMFRGALAVQAATGDLYALSVDAANNDNGLWQDLCGVAGSACSTPAVVFGHRIDAGAMDTGGVVVQGDYDLALAASAVGGGTLLLAGTVDVYRCVMAAGASACTLRNTTNAVNGCNAPATVAPAEHALALVGTLTFLGNDGGLWRSLDGVAETGQACSASDAGHFENLNGAIGSLAEVTGFAQPPGDAETLLVGLGANGSAGTSAASAMAAWAQLGAGEGGYPAIDAAQTSNWYVATGAAVSWKLCALGAACTAADFAGAATVGLAQVGFDAALLDAPTLLDPALTANLVLGTCRVWRGPAGVGSSWSSANVISKPLGGGSVPCGAGSSLVRSVAAGGPVGASGNAQNAGSTVLYAGMAAGGSVGGHVFVTTSAATANNATGWTDAGVGIVTNDVANAKVFNPVGFDVSSVMVDAHDATGGTVYATVMGFGVPHIYRSVDFGAHWLNLSANLPDAPANALAVDPNDANTVYLGLDTGVYVTTQVATCATASCWSLLGTGLPDAPVTGLAAAVNMPTGDGRNGTLRASTYGRGMWATPLLSATFPPQPAMTLPATSFGFAAQAVGTLSAAQTLTISSSGSAPMTIGTLTLTGDFVENDTCSGQTLPVGATCAVTLRFAPAAVGIRNGLLTIFANVVGGQASISLSGTGTAPAAIVVAPVALTFAATLLGQTTAAQGITVSNNGGTASALSVPVATGDFSVSASTCGATLGAGATCLVSVVFTPAASGLRTGTLSVTDDVGTQTTALTGTGLAPATDTVNPLSLTFATQLIGTTSAAQQVSITNSGDVALTGVSAGIGSGPFVVSGACGTVAARSTCVLSVVFAPTLTGAASGTLTVSDGLGTQTVTLSGTGVAPAGALLTPAGGLSFGPLAVGLTSTAQTLTLANNGGLTLTISAVSVSGDFRIVSTTCGTTVAVGATCLLTVTFVPTAVGLRNGLLTVSGNVSGGQATASLTGTGLASATLVLAPTTLTFAATALNQTTAAQRISVSNTGGTAAMLSAPVLTGDFQLAANTCGVTLAAQAGCALSVVFTPTASGVRSGTLAITDAAGMHNVLLTGTGLGAAAVVLTPTSLTFAATIVNQTMAAQIITVANTGGWRLR